MLPLIATGKISLLVPASAMEYHKPSGFINKTSLYLRILEGGKSKIKVVINSLSGERTLSGSHTGVFALCPCLAKRARECSETSLIRVLIPLLRAPPNHLLKDPLPNTVTVEIRF